MLKFSPSCMTCIYTYVCAFAISSGDRFLFLFLGLDSFNITELTFNKKSKIFMNDTSETDWKKHIAKKSVMNE